MDLVDILVAQHRAVERLFADVETTSDRAIRRDTLAVVMAALRQHSRTEERFMYPATRDSLSAGEDIVGHEEREHRDAARLMDRIGSLEDSAPGYEPLVSELLDSVRCHVQEEETEIFPRLRAACDPVVLERLGADAARFSA